MRQKLDEMNLDVQYSKAKAAFEHCITDKNNEFLNKEINISISEIITKNESVKIQFSGNDKNHYIIETLLLLFTPNDKKIGHFCYHENENEEIVDDYLIFD